MPETEKIVEEEPNARLRELEDLVEAHPQDASLRFDLGLFLWENGSESDAADHFLVSAKLNPNSAPAFKYLGHYYSHCCFAHGSHGSDKEKERERALKCYQRAISLDPNDADCGEALCDMLDVSGKESLELSVCEDASRKSPRSFWAFRRLGYLHLHRNRCSKAVQCLQQAIRAYPSSPDLWEALGLAYQRLGMFSAAIKSYARAIELEDTRVFGLVESGNIFLLLGSFRKGVEMFQRALQISPQNISANYGLASGLLGLSKECINSGAFRWGATLLEDACKVADANTQLAGNISCVWKLHGDIQLTYAKCFPWVEDSQKTPYNMETFHASIISWKQTCHLAVTSARRSYQRALHLTPWQANLYIDIAITSDLISSVNESYSHDIVPWQLSEKMALGGLLLEGDNYEFWVALGCLSTQGALKQHALIRGLQLDASLAAAWAYLGKLYREEGEVKLSRQAFDSARSIDPSLALPWAGMSADTEARESSSNEAFESCLRAVQILPLAEFQIGVAKLALLSGHVASSQVFGAITQAVHRAPHHPESHNLKGLVCEARSDYQSAIASYQLARWAIYISHDNGLKSHSKDVAVNLARSLCRAGFVADAVQECESLKKEGILDAKGMQIYAFSLWQLGENDLALSVIRSLAASVSRMEQTSTAATVSFICRLLYYISGPDSAITSILKMPKELLATSKVFSLVSAIHALDKTNRLVSAISSGQYSLSSPEESIRMHYLSVLSKLIKHGSEYGLGFQNGISHLKIALHMYPNSNLLRNLLGHLLLSSEEWKDIHMACRCCIMDSSYGSNKEGLISGCEILGAGGVACYAVGNKDPKFSFPTCGYQCQTGPRAVQELQKYLRREPWNHTARYLLTLNLLQKAREERFPEQLCITLDRLILVALSNEVYSRQCMPCEYQKFQLLLCASEINLQSRNQVRCIKHAEEASSLLLPNNYLFFGHLLLCRAYAAEGDYLNLREEYTKCMELKSDYHIGWICLKVMESLYDLGTGSYISELSFKECSTDLKNSWNIWMAVFNLCLGLISLRKGDLFSAEESLAQACSLASADSCVFLCHGTSCMELARQCSSTEFLSRAVRSLNKAHATSIIPLPIVSLLLAQAEGSLGSKAKWETNLRLEWYSWPPEMRPAELFFQMHLLARQQPATSSIDSSSKVEFCQSPQKWVTRAIHANPSCTRYWKVLQKLTE